MFAEEPLKISLCTHEAAADTHTLMPHHWVAIK